MRLRAYELTGDPKYTATPCVRIKIQCTQTSTDVISDFLRWCLAEQVYALPFGSTSGPGIYSGSFSPEDADRVIAWLAERGVNEGEHTRDN